MEKFPKAIYPGTPRNEWPDMDAVVESIRRQAKRAKRPPRREERQSDAYFDRLTEVRDWGRAR